MRRISFIVPTYNCENFVEECINSVISQISDKDELVLVDDGSSDGTRDVLKKYENIENINIIFNEHKGASGARNKGIDCAKGEYITFIDCDDLLKKGFISKSEELLKKNADLYIFGIERIPIEGNREFWKVRDNYYENVSDFADNYIKTRRLLIYSNCNKLYKKSIVDKMNLRFLEGLDFGEDRLFNFNYLKGCKNVVTSKVIMLSYVQRSLSSLSTKYVPNFFKQIKMLHKAKLDCFFGLAKNVKDEDKYNFAAYDLTREIENTIKRFKDNPKEEKENMPLINDLVFDNSYDIDKTIDIIVVFGSYNCEYKAKTALDVANKNPHSFIIVSGGNIQKEGKTEALFMRDYLVEHGIDSSRIYIEEQANNTYQNLDFSQEIIEEIRRDNESEDNKFNRIGLVTSAFHMNRIKAYIDRVKNVFDYELAYYSCYGENTGRDNWYFNPIGRGTIIYEFRKVLIQRSYLG